MTDVSPELSLAEQIDAICDQFEQDFRSGLQPHIESCLGESREPNRTQLLMALVGLEIELRQKRGEQPQPEEYITRFPNHGDAIREAFTEVRSILSSVKVSTSETSKGPAAPLVSASDSQPLQQLGRFQILSVLGEGAFGTVYRAYDPQLDREVAVKVPRFGTQQSIEDRERFSREARSAAGLHHPQICPVYEVGTIDGRNYIVMAFIDGKPLSKVMQTQTKLTEKQIVSVIRKIALALQEAHDKGVIHRDLKPANIMINRKGEPVIMDFGLARRTNSADAQISQSGQIMGTPAYMSPEQARGDGKLVGPAADIYGLGVMFYELLCGRRPFEGTITEVLGQILHVDAEPPSQHRPGIDPRLEEICLKSIAKKSADRFAAMKDFAAALADYVKTISTVLPTATAKDTAPAQDGALHTKQFAKLMAAVSSDLEDKVERAASRAVRRSHQPPKVPWWTYLVGSGLISVIIFLGIFFFIRKDTVTVIVNIPIENINDPSLSFILDKKAVAAEKFAAPIELKPGEHELIVNKDGKLFKQFLFSVGKADNQPVIVQDVTPKAAGPELAIAPFNAAEAKQYQEAWAKHLGVPVEYTNSIGMKFRLIPPGEYLRGSHANEIEAALATRQDAGWKEVVHGESPRHAVALTQPFYVATHETTQEAYEKVVGANPAKLSPSGAGKELVAGLSTKQFPVDNISQIDAAEFCTKLSQRESFSPRYRVDGKTIADLTNGHGYRLLTEAEWEFACRAGTTTIYNTGDEIGNLRSSGWFAENSEGRPHPVGELAANAFGLFDMHGNVIEWCADGSDNWAYENFRQQSAVNPEYPRREGMTCIYRGGDIRCEAFACRSASRNNNYPDKRGEVHGFRVALSVDAVKQALSRQATGPRRVEVKELNLTGFDTQPWLSVDGQRIYFLSRKPDNEPDEQPWVYVAARPDANSPFSGKRALFPAQAPTLTADELEMVFVRGVQPSGSSLRFAKRNSTNDNFAPSGEIPELMDQMNPRNPCLSEDGLTLLFQRGSVDDKSVEFAYSTRSDRNSPWQKPQKLPMTPDPTWTEPLTCPFLSRDGLTLWYCHGVGMTRDICQATRSDLNSPFGNHQRVIVEGTPLVGGSPRFVAATGELFYSPNMTGTQGDWSLWVVKNYATPQASSPPPTATASASDEPWTWSDPVHIGRSIDAEASGESTVALSPDELSILFVRSTPGVGQSIWRANRPSKLATFESPWKVEQLQTANGAGALALTGDGLTVFFDAFNDKHWDIWTARRPGLNQLFGPPERIRGSINTPGVEAKPSVTGDGLTLFFHSDRKPPDSPQAVWSIWMSRRTAVDQDFGVPVPLGPNINAAGRNWDPAISADGLVLIFSSDRPGGLGENDLWMSSRPSRDAAFGPATNLGPKINTAGQEGKPALSPDGQTLYFTSKRGGEGELWVSRRQTGNQTLPAIPSDGWIDLFNGKDLAGWRKTGVPSGWSVKNGEIVAEAVEQGRNVGWLMTEKDYSDFELQLEFMTAAGTDSGVAFRCDVNDTTGAGQAEIQIVDEQDAELIRVLDEIPHRRTGALAGHSSLRTLPKLERGVWHKMTLDLRERKLKVMVNGITTVATNLNDHVEKGKKMNRRGIWQPSGPIGLAKLTGTVRFRNIQIRE